MQHDHVLRRMQQVLHGSGGKPQGSTLTFCRRRKSLEPSRQRNKVRRRRHGAEDAARPSPFLAIAASDRLPVARSKRHDVPVMGKHTRRPVALPPDHHGGATSSSASVAIFSVAGSVAHRQEAATGSPSGTRFQRTRQGSKIRSRAWYRGSARYSVACFGLPQRLLATSSRASASTQWLPCGPLSRFQNGARVLR